MATMTEFHGIALEQHGGQTVWLRPDGFATERANQAWSGTEEQAQLAIFLLGLGLSAKPAPLDTF